MKVSIVKCDSYDFGLVYDSIIKSLELIDIWSELNLSGKRVLLKPNILVGAKPDEAVTTHPSVLRSVIRMVKEKGGIPVVGDSPAIGGASDELFKVVTSRCGLWQVTQEEDVEFMRYEQEFVEIDNPDGHVFKRIPVCKAVLDADVIINLPKLKTHTLVGLTLSTKNLFGCIPGKEKGGFHFKAAELKKEFREAILDIAYLIHPQLNIMDGIIGMEGAGPSDGNPRKIGAVISSKNNFALDLVAAEIAGFKLSELPIESEAIKRGYISFENIEITGEKVEYVRVRNFKRGAQSVLVRYLPDSVKGKLRNQLIAYPAYNYNKCVNCLDCMKICPAAAINQVDGVANSISKSKMHLSMDYKKCIRCYCCHEVCRYSAIDLRKRMLGKIFK